MFRRSSVESGAGRYVYFLSVSTIMKVEAFAQRQRAHDGELLIQAHRVNRPSACMTRLI